MKQLTTKVTTFVKEVKAELTKVSWPSRQELLDSTKIVLVSSAFLAFFIGLCDLMISVSIKWVLRFFE